MYLPMIGPAMAIAWALADFARTSARRQLIGIASAAVLAGLAFAAWRQVDYWRDSESLWTRAINCTSGNWLAYNNRGFIFYKTGRTNEAIADFNSALALRSDLVMPHNSLGLVYADRGDFVKAAAEHEAALAIDQNDVEAHTCLAQALMHLDGRNEEAITHFRRVTELQPNDADAHSNLGYALFLEGKLDEAINSLETAVMLKPGFERAAQNLAMAKQARARRDKDRKR
jgi:Flp pilus assembly protein TadD